MLSVLRLNMVEMERVRQPLGYFPTLQEQSSILGALHVGAFDEVNGPDYIVGTPIIRVLGRVRSGVELSDIQREQIHLFFLHDRPLYRRAHRKLQGN